MGRSMPRIELVQDVREEVGLARAVEEAVVRVAPAERPNASDAETSAVIQQVLSELDGAATAEGRATIASGTQPLPRHRLPIVFLDAIEVTQEVQDLDHSVPLIESKPTIVRAYLRYASGPIQVRGELRMARTAMGPWQTVPALAPGQLDPSRTGGSLSELRSRRANLDYSLNFRVPDNLTNAGTLWLRMGPIRRTTGTPLPSLAWLPLRTITFQQAVPLRMRLVRFRYTMGTPPVTHEPSATDVTLVESWLRRAYPIARLELTTTTATAAPAPPFGAAQINAQLIALRAVDVSTGTDARTHYYGMVADSGFFMRGLASGIPSTAQPDIVASGPTGPSSFGWDFDGSYGDWYGAHELGHTFGRAHAEFCGAIGGAPYPFPDGQLSDADEALVGLDVGDPAAGLPMRVMGGIDCHDVMSYCDDQWLSSFTYSAVYARLLEEEALSAGAGGGPAVAAFLAGAEGANPLGMRVIAALNLTRTTGAITSILPTTGGGGAPARGAEPHETTIRVLDADGAILDERPVAFQPSACEDPDEDATGVVDAVIPSFKRAASVDLLIDGQVVDRHPVGGEPAPVGDLLRADREVAGLGQVPGGELQLRWEAPGAPAGQRYTVQTSDDAGATWRTVAVGLAEPAVTLASDDLKGDEVTIRILSTTGSGTTVIRTDTVPLR